MSFRESATGRQDASTSRIRPARACGYRATTIVPGGTGKRGKQTNCPEYKPKMTIQPGFSRSISSAIARAFWSSAACIAGTSSFTCPCRSRRFSSANRAEHALNTPGPAHYGRGARPDTKRSPASLYRRPAAQRALNPHTVTGLYAAAGTRFAVISVTPALTAWTDGRQIWCTRGGQRRTWPAADPHTAAAALAALARLAGS